MKVLFSALIKDLFFNWKGIIIEYNFKKWICINCDKPVKNVKFYCICVFSGSPDVWQCLAALCNSLASVYHGEIPLFKADADGESDELQLLVLEEDRMLAGFVPLLAAPQEPCYIDLQSDIVSPHTACSTL